jgi:hypothetical protein
MSNQNSRRKRGSAPPIPTPRPVEVINPRYAGATPEDVARALLRRVGPRRPKQNPSCTVIRLQRKGKDSILSHIAHSSSVI